MPVTREALLFTAGDALRQALVEQGAPVPPVMDETTAVFGHGAALDSLGLVTLVMEMELRMEEQHGLTVVLADERALSRRHGPFRTLGTLVEHVLETLGRMAA